MNQTKITYQEICKNIVDLPIFYQPWWLDIVCGKENWNVIIASKGERILGLLPYCRTKKYFFKGIGMPLCTHFLGPWILYPDHQKYSSKLSFEKKVLEQLFEQLPHVSFYEQLWHPKFVNWLPLYWMDYQQRTTYTYVIDNHQQNADLLFSEFDSKTRNVIRKAEKLVTIHQSDDPDLLHHILSKSFARHKMKMPYSKKLLHDLLKTAIEKNAGQFYIAKDEHGNIHSGLFCVWDKKTVYFLLRGDDPKYRSSGAASLLIWQAIQDHIDKVEAFDFVGSYIKAIEHFVSGFGTKQIPYFHITKSYSKIHAFAKELQQFR